MGQISRRVVVQPVGLKHPQGGPYMVPSTVYEVGGAEFIDRGELRLHTSSHLDESNSRAPPSQKGPLTAPGDAHSSPNEGYVNPGSSDYGLNCIPRQQESNVFRSFKTLGVADPGLLQVPPNLRSA